MQYIHNITLRQLEIFVVAARHVNFSRAAADLHLSVPAVSMQLKQLESYVGLPLFDRVGRGLRLTEAGEKLARHAWQIMGQIKDAEADLQALVNAEQGSVNVGVISTAKYFMPKLLVQFSRQHPGIEVHFSVGNRELLISLLQDNSIDMAIMGRPPKELETRAEALADQPYVLIAPPDHPLRGVRELDLHELRAETFLLREPGSGSRTVTEEMFANHRFTPARSITLGSNETIKQAVMAGLGVSLLSMHTMLMELRIGAIAILGVKATPITRVWHIMHMHKKKLSPACEKFWGYLLENTPAHLQREAVG